MASYEPTTTDSKDRVSVTRRDVVTIHVDIDMPEPLLAAMRDAMRSDYGANVAHQIIVNIGGNRVGIVSPFGRQWRHFTEQMESY